MLSEAWVRYIAGHQGFIVNKGGKNHTIAGTATQQPHRAPSLCPTTETDVTAISLPCTDSIPSTEKEKSFLKNFKDYPLGYNPFDSV